MRLRANHAVRGHKEKAVGQDGEGQEAKERQALLNPRMKKEQRIIQDGKDYPFDDSRCSGTSGESSKRGIVGIRVPGWGWESRNLNSRPGSAIHFLGLTFLSLSFLLCKITIIWLPTSLDCSEII